MEEEEAQNDEDDDEKPLAVSSFSKSSTKTPVPKPAKEKASPPKGALEANSTTHRKEWMKFGRRMESQGRRLP